MASHDKRRRRAARIPRAEVTAAPLDGPDRVGAFLQEINAGAAPLTGIIAIPAEIPTPTTPRGFTVATVPFLTTPFISWNKVATGDSLHQLIQLLQHRGGLWLARRTTAVVEWTVGPTHEPPDTPPEPSPEPDPPDTNPQSDAWVRVDFTFTGAWNAKFALAGPARGLADELWCIAMSPFVGVLPHEVVGKALPTLSGVEPVAWDQFTRSLDNTLHTTTNPSEAIRRLVLASRWPGSARLAH